MPGAGLNGGFDGSLKMVYKSYDWLKKGCRQAKERRSSVKRSAPTRAFFGLFIQFLRAFHVFGFFR